MNAKSRIAIFALVLAVLFSAIASTASAGEAFNLLTGNNDFDTLNEHGFPFITPWWTLTNKSGDKLDCSGFYYFTGDCSFRFKGSANESSKLKQIVKGEGLEAVNGFASGSDVNIQLDYMIASLSKQTNLKAKAVVTAKVNGNTVKYKSIANFKGSTMVGTEFHEWVNVEGNIVLVPQNADIKKVAVTFANKSTKGKAFVDAVNVMFWTVN